MPCRQSFRRDCAASARNGFACLLVALLVGGCVAYEPVPAYFVTPQNFNEPWDAALAAVKDAGVTVTSTNAGSGLIRGGKDGIEVTVSVVRQADGRTRVQFDTQGPTERDPGLSQRFAQAYESRMGR